MPLSSNCLLYRLEKPTDTDEFLGRDLRKDMIMSAADSDLCAPVWLVGYIIHNMQHGEFAKSCKRDPEIGPLVKRVNLALGRKLERAIITLCALHPSHSC